MKKIKDIEGKKLKNMKRKIFGIPIALLVIGVLLIGGVSAALMTYFGIITTTINVDKAVTLGGTGCVNDVCIDTTSIFGGETTTSELYIIASHTSVDGEVELTTVCSATVTPNSCADVITTPIFELSIPTVTEANSVQDRVVAKSNAIAVNDITTLTFDYNLTITTTKNSPYFVLVFDTNGDSVADTWAVSLQDTATEANTWYTHGNGLLYHNVGTCTQSNPCNLAGLKTAVGSGNLLQVKVMIGYWGDITATTALVKNIKINGVDVTVNGLVIRHYDSEDQEDLESGETIVDFLVETTFPYASIPAEYTITTNIVPVTE